MNKKSLWSVIIAVVVIAVLAAYAVYYQKGIAPVTTAVNPANQTPAMANPNAPGMPVLGTYVSSTATSITIKTQSGGTRTFAITGNTPVISTTLAGQVAEGLGSVKAGAPIEVVPSITDASAADNIQLIIPPPPPSAAPVGSTMVTITGTEVSHTTTSMVVTNQVDGSKMTIAITKDTHILSNVSAGQKGKGLSDIVDGSSYVNINASKTGSAYTANSIQILIPIERISAQQ